MDCKYRVGSWIVNASESCLYSTDSDDQASVSLEPKAMALLVLLTEAEGNVVSRQAIMEKIWNGRYVSDFALNSLVSNLRNKLNKGNTKDPYIKTHPKRGYQLVAPSKKIVDGQKTNSTSALFLGDDSAHLNSGFTRPKSALNKTHRGNTYLLGVFAFLVLCMGVFYFINANDAANSEPDNLPISIAVLPFKILESETEIDYFADGLAEEVIHQLSLLPNSKVISRRSSFTFRESELPVPEIAQRLGVSYILEGSIREKDEVMRITVQLVNGIDGTYLWSNVFSASENEPFSAQYEISREVASSIDNDFVDFPDENKRHSTESPEAYLHVLRGMKYNRKGTVEALILARDEFAMATKLDPDYAFAHVNFAVNYLLLGQNKRLAFEDAKAKAEQALDIAFSIDPDNANTHSAQGVLYHFTGQNELAKDSFEKALALDPNEYVALVNYANMLRSSFNKAAALPLYLRAKALAPLSDLTYWGISDINIGLANLDASREALEQCVYLVPKSSNCNIGLSYNAKLTNDLVLAEEAFEVYGESTSKDNYWFRLGKAFHLMYLGKSDEANLIYETLISQFGMNIGGLQSITLLKSKLTQSEEWHSKMSSAYADFPQSLSIKSNFAFSGALSNRCEDIMAVFQSLEKTYPDVFVDGDIMANSVSYYAYMAHCYKKMGNAVASQLVLNQLKTTLENLPKNQLVVPGIMFVQAQYFYLLGEVDEAERIVGMLRDINWPLIWRVQHDPILGGVSQE